MIEWFFAALRQYPEIAIFLALSLGFGVRFDRVVSRVRAIQGNRLLFPSGHFLRVLAARWLGLEPGAGRYFLLSTASVSALGCPHNLSQPVIRLWDDPRPVGN
jgi:probable phosphoglycerate mutase